MTAHLDFTKARLTALKPAKTGRRDYYNDSRVQGLQLIVTDRGQKSFYLYAWFQGKPKRFRIGGYPDLTPDMARQAARKMRGEVAQDHDPTAERKRRRVKGTTLREVLEAFRLARRQLKPRTINDYQRFLETIFVDWIDKPFTDITRDKVSTRHALVTTNSGPAHADNAMRSLRSLLNFAMEEYQGPNGERPMIENPVIKLSQTRAWNKVARRETVISEHQLKPWFAAVLEIKHTMAPDSQDALVADYLLLLMLTGLRRSEGAGLTWERVDWEGKSLTIRDTKYSQKHILPLSDYLVEL
ncbi:MAG: integrase arm-type DNA-binding domain-containing protein, partial [Steroidobacteraceae bacterium]